MDEWQERQIVFKKLNVGAMFLGPVWCIYHRAYWQALMFILLLPLLFFGWFGRLAYFSYIGYIGKNGYHLADVSGRYAAFEELKSSQKKWGKAALYIYMGIAVIIVLLMLIMFLS